MTMKKTFAYHKPSEDGLKKITALRAAFSYVSDLIDASAHGSRERLVAQTKLEEAAMWAIKAVVLHDPNSLAEESPEVAPLNSNEVASAVNELAHMETLPEPEPLLDGTPPTERRYVESPAE